MKTQLFYSHIPIKDFKFLVESYEISEFSSPMRSTIPSLIYWKNLEPRILEFFRYINVNAPATVNACFEYTVPVQGGKGKASHTDLMLFSKKHVVAIEAKYTEPPYDSVQKWLGDPSTENRLKVLDGWLGLIQKVTNIKLSPDDVSKSAYQLIHRTASACYPNGKSRFVVYQCFDLDKSKKRYYKEQLSKLSELLRSSNNLRFYLFNYPLIKSNEYKKLEALWNNGTRKLESPVKKGLIEGKMLDFGTPVILRF
jgi:hypothetical protein